jgi:uroporphyrinogen decarboxylase
MNTFAPYKPDFHRLHQTLLAQKADRVPLMELGIDEGIMGDFLGRPIVTLHDKIDFFRQAGYDYIKLSPIIDMNPAGITPETGFRQSGATEHDRSRKWGSEGKGVIASPADFDRFEFAVVRDEQFKLFEEATRILPGDMKVIGQYGDIFTFVWELMGFETFSFALVENPDLVQAMFDRIGAIIYRLFERMAQFDIVGGLFYSDDIAYQTGLMMSPRALRQHLFPWMKKIGALCRQRQMPYVYHSDGILWDVMDDLLDTGITALQPIEPKAWDIVKVKKQYGDRLALVGNVDVDLLARATPEAIRTEVLRLIDQVGSDGGYCVGSGNTVPNYVKLENYRAMLETTWSAGTF